jgi:hypothetical protein
VAGSARGAGVMQMSADFLEQFVKICEIRGWLFRVFEQEAPMKFRRNTK